MTDKPLSEQIEQADASEFVKYANLLADVIVPSPAPLNNTTST